MHRVLLRVLFGLTLLTGVGATPVVAASPTPVAAESSAATEARAARTPHLTRVCLSRDSRKLSAPRSGECRRPLRTRQLRVTDRLAVCLTEKSATLGRGAACRRTDGVVRRLPGRKSVTVCARGRQGMLRHVARPGRCTTRERAFLIGDRAPRDLEVSGLQLVENLAPGSVVGALEATDPDAGDFLNFALVPGEGDDDNAAFTLDGPALRTVGEVDHEKQSAYRIRVRARDALGRSTSAALTLAVTDQVENRGPGAIVLTPGSIAENRPADSVVGTLTTSDPDAGDTHTYRLLSDGLPFALQGDRLRTTQSLDHELRSSYTLSIRSTDAAGESVIAPVTITVTDVNEAPTDIALSASNVAEAVAAGSLVGSLSTTDPDAGDTYTYELLAGGAAFEIVGDELRTVTPLDSETTPTIDVSVKVTDSGALSVTKPFTISVEDVNEAPDSLSLAGDSVDENLGDMPVGNFSATDPDGTTSFTFSLVAGSGSDDNGQFVVVGSELRTRLGAGLDHETGATRTVRVQVEDADGLAFQRSFLINVGDVNEAPSAPTPGTASIAENQPVGTEVVTFASTDPDAGSTLSFDLVAGAGDDDNALFSLSPAGELTTATTLDHESKASASVRVRVSDGTLSVARIVTVTITDANDQPSDVSLAPATIAENNAPGAVVGALAAVDQDAGDSAMFELVAGAGDADNAAFRIDGDELLTRHALDHEDDPSLQVLVKATDGGGKSYTKALVVTVTDVNEAASQITLAPDEIVENDIVGAVVGALDDDDPEGGTSYSFVTGTGDSDNAMFEITGDQVSALSSFNHEVQDTYSIRVLADDGAGNSFAQALTISVTDVNETPTNVTLSSTNIPETAPIGSVVGTLGTVDPDVGDSFSYELLSGTSSFEVVGSQLRTTSTLDATATPTIDVQVRSTDSGSLTTSRTFTITVDDVNEAPDSLTLVGDSVDENLGDALVGDLSATDPDGAGTFTFSLVGGDGSDDNDSFAIVGDKLRTKAGAGLDHEAGATRSVRVQVQDAGGLTFQRSFVITVNDVNEAPTVPAPGAVDVDENVVVGTAVATFSSSDPDAGSSLTFSLVSGTGDVDNGLFSLSAAGELTTAAAMNHETQASASIRVQVSDGTLSAVREVTVTVRDLNEASTAITLTPDHIAENNAPGAVVGALAGDDPDAGDTQAYELVSGTGSDDNARFNLVGDELRAVGALDREATAQPLHVRVRVTDAAGLTFEDELTVTVDNVNEQPTALTWADGTTTAKSVDENLPAGTSVASIQGTDPDTGDTLTFSLQAGDTAKFTLDAATGELKTAEIFDYEAITGHSYSITVRVSDAGGLHLDRTFTVDVNDVNDAPTVVDDGYTGALGNTQAKAGTPVTTGPVVSLTGALPLANDSDQDAGDTISAKPVTQAATDQGGVITVESDGEFVYLPPVGARSVEDTFTYTVADNHGLESTGQLTISIGSRVIWYVDDGAAAGGDGRSSAPFQALTPLDGAVGADQAGDQIYVYQGSYTSGIQLLADQRLTGAGVELSGVLPAGTPPTIGASSGSVVALASGTRVEGVNVSATGSAVALRANAVDAATVAGSVTITGGASDAVSVTGGGGALAVAAPITAGTGRAIAVSGRTSGSVTFSGLVTQAATSQGISLTSNTGALAFTGGVRLQTGTSPGLVATNSGTLSITGSTNSLASTTGTALSVSGTTIDATGLTFATISSNGAASGIVLSNTGTSGSLKVTGTSSGGCGAGAVADCTGGSIVGSSAAGISLTSTSAPSFTRMRVVDGAGDGISATTLTGGMQIAHSLVDDNGDANDENGIDLANPGGAVSISSSTISRSGDVNVHLGASTGTSTLTVTSSRINAAGSGTGAPAGGTGSIRDGILANVSGSANVKLTFEDNALGGNLGDHIQVASSGGTVASGSSISRNTLTGGTVGALGQGIVVNAAASPWTGSLRVAVDSNVISGSRASGISLSQAGASGATFQAWARNNTIGTATESCSQTSNGITVGNDQSSSPMVLGITGNTIRNCFARGINMTVGDGASSVHATVTGNTVSGLPDTARTGFEANIGTTSADSGTSCLAVSSNSFTGATGMAGLRIRHRYAGLLLPGYTGGSADFAAVQAFLAGQNPATGVVEVTEPISGTFGNSAGCTTPSV